VHLVERRSFLKFVSAMMTAAGRIPLVAETQPKRLLVLGVTSFLGPAFVEAALADGHTVSLFNRGVATPELFPYVESYAGLERQS
jgi:2'-hydroxyisoflavone reductase